MGQGHQKDGSHKKIQRNKLLWQEKVGKILIQKVCLIGSPNFENHNKTSSLNLRGNLFLKNPQQNQNITVPKRDEIFKAGLPLTTSILQTLKKTTVCLLYQRCAKQSLKYNIKMIVATADSMSDIPTFCYMYNHVLACQC